MGYTHYYRYATADPAFQRAWPRMVADARLIVERVEAVGVALDRYDGPPVTDERILVNGDWREELDAESLWITPDTSALPPYAYDEHGVVDTFCKTERMPYDLAVAAILLRCHLLAPRAFEIDSDGEWDEEWAEGAAVLDDDGTWGPGARTVVAELFGGVPRTSPFSES